MEEVQGKKKRQGRPKRNGNEAKREERRGRDRGDEEEGRGGCEECKERERK